MLNFSKKKDLTCIFDIGNSKIVCIVIQKELDGYKIVGVGHKKSKGLFKNRVVNQKMLSTEISRVYDIALKNHDKTRLNKVYCNITDSNFTAKKYFSNISVGNFGVSKKTVREIYKNNISKNNLETKKIIHSFPRSFYIEDKKIVENPIGIKTNKLGFSSYNILIDKNLHNIFYKAFAENKIFVDEFFESGIASAFGNLTDYEKKSGAVLIDIGYYSSKIVVFLDKEIIYTGNIPIAGQDVTNDISKGLGISDESAEFTKVVHGSLNHSINETIQITFSREKVKKINNNLLLGIIKPRYEEILEIVRDNLFDNLHARMGINKIILTGGASKIFGLENLSMRLFNRKSRIGKTNNSSNFFHNKPEFSTLAGIIKLSENENRFDFNKYLKKNKISGVFDRIESWIEDSYA